jgi:hypothetical protein
VAQEFRVLAYQAQGPEYCQKQKQKQNKNTKFSTQMISASSLHPH